MRHTFKTRADATAAGYVVARGRHDLYRGFSIEAVDVSGGRSFGYRYELRVHPHRGGVYEANLWGRATYDHDAGFGLSVTAWFTDDLNRMHQPGCFIEMFPPETLRAGIAAAHATIDAFWAAHPGLAAEIAAIDHAAAVRQAARTKRRAEKLAAKYGAQNLRPEWQAALGQ